MSITKNSASQDQGMYNDWKGAVAVTQDLIRRAMEGKDTKRVEISIKYACGEEKIKETFFGMQSTFLNSLEALGEDNNLEAPSRIRVKVIEHKSTAERLADLSNKVKRLLCVSKGSFSDRLFNEMPEKTFVAVRFPEDAYSFDDPKNPNLGAPPKEIGSFGFQHNEDKSVAMCHKSYGNLSIKKLKQGRNCDRAFGGKLEDGSFIIGVFDGVGVKAEALKTAAACSEFLLRALSDEPAFRAEESEEECQRTAIDLFTSALQPSKNPLISKSAGYRIIENGVSRTSGGSTATILRGCIEGESFVIRGAFVGDSPAFILTNQECERLSQPEDSFEEHRDVTDTGGALVGPKEGEDGKIFGGGKWRIEEIVLGIHGSFSKEARVLVASDGLSDNLCPFDMERALHYIVCSQAFDVCPEMAPPNQYSGNPDDLPSFDWNGDLTFLQEIEGQLPPGKPTSDYLRLLFGEEQSVLPSNPVIVERLNNYVKWMMRGLEETEKVFASKTFLDLVLDLIPWNTGDFKGLTKEGMKKLLQEWLEYSGINKSVDDASEQELYRVLNKMDSQSSFTGEISHYSRFFELLKTTLSSFRSAGNIASNMLDLEIDLNAREIKHTLYLIKHKIDRKRAVAGKFDDLTIVVAGG